MIRPSQLLAILALGVVLVGSCVGAAEWLGRAAGWQR